MSAKIERSAGRSQRAVALAAAGLIAVAVLAFVATRVGQTVVSGEYGARSAPAGAVSIRPESGALAAGYPGWTPTASSPTPTPSPDQQGLFPPPDHIPWRMESLASSPHGAELQRLALALAEHRSADIAALIGDPESELTLGQYVESEGGGARPTAQEIEDWLESLFASGSSPVIQGYFEPGCGGSSPTCALFVCLTGFDGQLPMPTKDPGEVVGLEPPAEVPLEAAAWELLPDGAGGLWWRAWWLGTDYYGLLTALSEKGLGEYVVLR